MAKYSFIDESGTMPGQKFMTVALVMLDGRRTAEHLHNRLVSSIFEQPKFRGQKDRTKWLESKKLHHYEMNDCQKFSVGKILAQADITAFVAYCTHVENRETHKHRFFMYRRLIYNVVEKVFEHSPNLVVSIAKQGGWENYGAALTNDLREFTRTLNSQGKGFYSGDFLLASPSKPGHQIADFYASSGWQHLLSMGHTHVQDAFDLVQHQIKLIRVEWSDEKKG